MHIIFFTHPSFVPHQSMPRYAAWLAKGMEERGHTTELWTAQPYFFNLPIAQPLKKWMSYIDQYVIFPRQAKQKIRKAECDTLFVFTDHALGPWAPLANGRRHVIHCHDFLAQRSALGQIARNPTSRTGKWYQTYIRKGYSKGKNFISISQKTEQDLLYFLTIPPRLSAVIYNAVSPFYRIIDTDKAKKQLAQQLPINLSAGFVLHVGGNQWYKNRVGVILLYSAWRSFYQQPLPLLLIGEEPDALLKETMMNSSYREDIHFISGLTDETVLQAYNAATVFLFPSLAEGFGWPIAEAMACGCPVITTSSAPMTEVGGDAAFYTTMMPVKREEMKIWLKESATVLQQVVNLTVEERKAIISKGLKNIQRFDSTAQLDKIAAVYAQIV